MNLKKLLFGALSVGLMTACSNDLPDPANGGQQTGGDGYIAVRINMPMDRATRAFNDVTDDGTPDEYKVTDAVLVLFQKLDTASEGDATFAGAYDLDTMTEYPDVDNNQITTTYLKAVKINKGEAGKGDLYGIVMLNYKNVVNTTATDNLSVKASDGSWKTVTKFNDLVEGTQTNVSFTADKDGNPYFFMANAPMSNAAGGTVATAAPTAANISTLIPMGDKVYETETLARNNPSACFYVERGVAKITIAFKDGKTGNVQMTAQSVAADGTVSTVNTPAFIELGYALGNTEGTSYVVRNMGDLSYIGYNNGGNYRMVGHQSMPATAEEQANNLYRTYWCIDPHYSTVHGGDKTNNDATIKNYVTEDPLYCYENTFDVEHMNYLNTTRGLIKLNVSIGGDGATYFTINDDQSVIYLDEAKAENKSRNYIINWPAVQKAFEDALKPNKTFKLTTENADTYLDIKFLRESDGYRRVQSITLKAGGNSDFKDEYLAANATIPFADAANLKDKVNQTYKIAEYAGGINYYDFRFQHFGQELTPWYEAKVPYQTADSTLKAYFDYDGFKSRETAANAFLGRYGLVRNNWYDVTIDEVKRLGMPEVTDVTVTTPDDEKNKENWIAFHINVLSWAKRTQHVNL